MLMDSVFWQSFLVSLINAIIPVLLTALPLVLTAIFGLIIQYIRLVQAKIQKENPTEYSKIEFIAKNAVLIAEQMKLGGFIQDKKKYAVEYAQRELDKAGIKLNVEQVAEEIEKAVYMQFNDNFLK